MKTRWGITILICRGKKDEMKPWQKTVKKIVTRCGEISLQLTPDSLACTSCYASLLSSQNFSRVHQPRHWCHCQCCHDRACKLGNFQGGPTERGSPDYNWLCTCIKITTMITSGVRQHLCKLKERKEQWYYCRHLSQGGPSPTVWARKEWVFALGPKMPWNGPEHSIAWRSVV